MKAKRMCFSMLWSMKHAIIYALLIWPVLLPAQTSLQSLETKCRRIALEGEEYYSYSPTREDAIIALGLIGGDRNADFLGGLLKSEQRILQRARIAKTLAWTHSKKAIPFLVHMLENEPDDYARSVTFHALISFKDPGTFMVLERYIKSVKADDRPFLIRLLEDASGKDYSHLQPAMDEIVGYDLFREMKVIKALQEQKKSEEALARAMMGVFRWSDDWRTHFVLAYAYEQQNNLDEAGKAIQRARDLEPTAFMIIFFQANIAESAGKKQKAKELYLEALKHAPDEYLSEKVRKRLEAIEKDRRPPQTSE